MSGDRTLADTLVNGDYKSIKLSKTHRLVRRGRPYGEPIHSPLDPACSSPSSTRSSRIHRPACAACTFSASTPAFGANSSSFTTWLNNPKFAGQYASPDPIAGQFKEEDGAEFILPGCPASTRITKVKSFVQSKGGAYFFMPGIKSLRALARSGP